MNAKHTPGEWRKRDVLRHMDDGSSELLRTEIVNDKGDVIVADVDDRFASLIAAAPGLLDALRSFALTEDRIVAAQGSDMILRVPMAVITAAAAALAKAEA